MSADNEAAGLGTTSVETLTADTIPSEPSSEDSGDSDIVPTTGSSSDSGSTLNGTSTVSNDHSHSDHSDYLQYKWGKYIRSESNHSDT